MQLTANTAVQAAWVSVYPRPKPTNHHHAMPKLSERPAHSDHILSAAVLLLLYLPTEVTVVPLDGEICSNLGSIKGVKEEEDLCFWSVLLAD